MVNKSDYIALVNTKLPDGANIPSTDHRDTMHTNENSIGEAIFGDSISDDEATETYTASNANFDYNITFVKVGTLIVMSGRFSANSTLSAGQKIFDITDSKLLQATGSRYDVVCAKPNSTDALPVFLLNNDLLTNATVFTGEGFRFQITYKSEN